MTKLYWAYGSNLCHASMRRRCPDARPLKRLDVGESALVFRGVADVTIRKGSTVVGGLWSISPDDEAALDRYEGAPRFYMKRYLPIQYKGQLRKVLFYQMRADRGVMPPSEDYVAVIARGYQDFGLPLESLDRALAASWEDKDVTPMLRRRHEEKGRKTLARELA